MKSSKKRIAWFSPLNLGGKKSSSISAYVSDLLLPHLKGRFEIELFHDSFDQFSGFKTNHYLAAYREHKQNPFDLFFYQFEDKRSSAFVRMHLGLIPGATLFHDLLVTQDGPEPILNSPWEETVRHFLSGERKWPERGAEFLRERPYAVREAGYALTPIFSCPRMHRDYLELSKGKYSIKKVDELQSFYLPLPVNIKSSPWPDSFVIGFCGSPRIEHGAHKMLEALSRYETPANLIWLVAEEDRVAAESLVKEFEVERVELIVGSSPNDWERVIERCSVAVHLLYSVYGQSGPYLQISMMAGRPCLVTNFGGTEYLSDKNVWKVRPGQTQTREIHEVFGQLANLNRRDLGANGRELVLEENEVRKVAGELTSIFDYSIEALKEPMNRWNELERDAGFELVRESAQLLGNDVWRSLCRDAFTELGWMNG